MSKPIQILLAEDNPTDALLVGEALRPPIGEPERFSLTHVERLGDVLRLLGERSFDVLLLDLGLPDSQGLESLSRVRQAAPSLPVVVLTGLSDEASALEALSEGAEDYLVKGQVEGQNLARAIRYAMERHAAEQRHRESETRFRSTFENAAVGIAHLSPSGQCLRVNQTLCTILGYSADKLMHRTLHDITHPKDRAAEQSLLDRLLAGQQDTYSIENRCIRADGEPIWVNRTMSVTHTVAGDAEYLIAVIQDISERRRAQADRDELLLREQAARAQAEAAIRAKDQFLGVVSHELRTPLTPVLLLTSALRASKSLPAEIRDDIETIHSQVQLEVRLIDDLLDLTRSRSGKLQLRPRRVNAHDLLARAFRSHEAEIREKNLHITTDLRAEHYEFTADPDRLQQVFINLLSNAIKFTPASGHISVTTENHAGRFQLSITDSGIGIEPDVMQRLFGPFEQAEQQLTRRFGGLGLGLTICKAIVELHHGSISAFSNGKDRGATFTVEIPLASSLPAQAPADHTPSKVPALRILLVEDDPGTLRVLSRILQNMGHTVHTESSVESAYTAASNRKFDLLVSDIGLPDGSGWELMRRLRTVNRFPAIALSGFSSDEDIQRSKEAGFLHHLAKPISILQLDQVLQTLTNSPSGLSN